MQDARIAIAMGYTSKYKRELDAEREYHIATRKRLGQALQVTQYLQAKIETLRGVVAGLSMGSELEIPLPCFSEDLEVMERTVLERAGDSSYVRSLTEWNVTPPALHAPRPSPKRQQKRRKLKHTSSNAAADLTSYVASSDGVDPAAAFSSDSVCPTDLILATTSPLPVSEPDSVDLEALEQQLELAQEVLGREMAETPVGQRILHKAEGLTREQLERMWVILNESDEARTSISAFADQLFA